MNSKPKLSITSSNLVKLEKIIDSLDDKSFIEMEDFLRELERAQIIAPELISSNVVTMNSIVRFRVSSSDKEFILKLVYPQHDHDNKKEVSIFTPVGRALLGLSEGDSIEWAKPVGGTMLVKVIEVIDQPERSEVYNI